MKIVSESKMVFKKQSSEGKVPLFFEAISSPVIMIQNSIFSLMMTSRIRFTYYSFNHLLVVEYVNVAVSVTFFIIKNAENFRKTIINRW